MVLATKSPLPAVARGDRAFGKKDLPTAEAAYREALKLQGDNPVVCNRLIDVLVNEKKFTDAASVIDAALATAKTPDDIGLLVLKARVRVVDKKYDEGIRLYKQAIKASRDAHAEAKNYLIHYELGQLYMSLERPNDARQSLDAACELNPDFIDGRLALMDVAVRQNNLNESHQNTWFALLYPGFFSDPGGAGGWVWEHPGTDPPPLVGTGGTFKGAFPKCLAP